MENQTKVVSLVLHYLDDSKAKKGLWLYKKSAEGALYFFHNEEDDFGGLVAKCDLKNINEGDTFAFIVLELKDGLPDWTKTDGKARYIRFSKNIIKNKEVHVYAVPEIKNPRLMYEKPHIITFHYRREKEDYENWKLYIHTRGDFGDSYSWRKDIENPGYVYVKVPVELYGDNPNKIWFKTYRGNWEEEDSRIDRCVRMKDFKQSQQLDVYIRNMDLKIYFQKPKILHTRINVYYHRHDDDYDIWCMNYFTDKQNNFQRHIRGFGLYGGDSVFKKVSFELDYLEDAKELHYYLRGDQLTDPIDYRRAPLKENEMNVYMVQDVAQTFSSREAANKHLSPKILKAVFHNPGDTSSNFNTIWFETNIPLTKEVIAKNSNFSVISEDKKKISVLSIKYTDETKRRFGITIGDWDIKPFISKYNLKINHVSSDKAIKFEEAKRISIERLFDRNDFNEKYCYLHENIKMDFGLIYNNSICQFTLWSPTADQVRLKIYDKAVGGNALDSIDMNFGAGLWFTQTEKEKAKQYNGKYYTFEITEHGIVTEVMDPYAKACGINAQRGAILDLLATEPEDWKNHERPKGPMYNPVIYELHIKDFTMGKGSTVSEENQGKYLGVIEKIEHLKNLGINCVQLMPVTKFDTDETLPYGECYNWGYDQLGLWFLPEGIYSKEPQNPASRIKEFKTMVKTFHQNGIRVIIDAVHNHTYETENSIYSKISKGYYYRHCWDDSFSNGSGCGNELKTERPIVSKLIRDYLKYWVKEMGIDGFRFDLMSLTDKFTMEKIRKDIDTVRPYILLYGEAYRMGWSILPYDLQSSKENMMMKELVGVGGFTDIGSRNAIRGYNDEPGLASGSNINSKASDLFYVGQKGEFLDFSARNNPTQKVYNYIDIHDDMLLIDYLKLPHQKMGSLEIIQRYKLAYSMLFNYIGPIVLKSGSEGVTTKLKDHNSYRTEEVNLIDWYRMEKHKDILKYFSEYIKFRLSHPAYVMSRHDVNTKFDVLDCHRGFVKGKIFKDYANGDPCNKLLIYHNLSKTELEIALPQENAGWAILCNDKTAGNKRIGYPISSKLIIPPLTTIVLGDNHSVEKMMITESDPLSYLIGKNQK